MELRDPRDIKLFSMLMNKYHRQGARYGFAKPRVFVGVKEGFWVAGAILQDPRAFAPLFSQFRLDTKRSYFVRRIAKFCPGDHLVEFLRALAERLAGEGKELLVTLGYEDHSNALYKRAGFEYIGTSRTGKPVFVLRLEKVRATAP